MNYTKFTVAAFYADYTDNRFGKTLRVRQGNNSSATVLRLTFPKTQEVTYAVLNAALRENGYTLAGNWKIRSDSYSVALKAA